MRKRLTVLLLLLALCVPVFAEEAAPAPRFDGLYAYVREADNGAVYNSVLRFYPEGVIGVTVAKSEETGRYFPRASWFNREDGRFDGFLGPWTAEGNRISLSILSDVGTLDYAGELQPDRLILTGFSHINGRDIPERVFVFVPFDEIPGWLDV